MHVILIHGMGRTPAAMAVLAARLRRAGMHPEFFYYSATFERYAPCVTRLADFIRQRCANRPFIIAGHSLGAVLARAALPQLADPPQACFLIASPTTACRAARQFAPQLWYRCLTGEMGQLLAQPEFMQALPLPPMPAKIYAGTGGPTGRFSPFGDVPNDGILALNETELPSVPLQTVPAVHTFIMNTKPVADDMIAITRQLAAATNGSQNT